MALTGPPRSRATAIHVYVDSSGHFDYPKGVSSGKGDTEQYVAVAAVMSDEQRRTAMVDMDALASKIFPDREPSGVEFHAVDLVGHHPEPPWDAVEGLKRKEVLDRLRDIILKVRPICYGQVLNKRRYWDHFSIRPEEPASNAFRYLLTRVDKDLARAQIVATLSIDEDSNEMKKSLREMIARVRIHGDKLTPQRLNLSFFKQLHDGQFIDSRMARGIQIADFVAYWTFRAAEHRKANRLRELDLVWRHAPPPAGAPPHITGRRTEPFLAFNEDLRQLIEWPTKGV